jgi:hypothetical protein
MFVGDPWGGEASTIFEKAEKPLRWEIFAQGLRHDHPADWDNIHLWQTESYPSNAQVDLDKNSGQLPWFYPLSSTNLKYLLPSTPGGFFCVHTHWNWMEAAKDSKDVSIFVQKYFKASGPHFGRPKLDDEFSDISLRLRILNSNTLPPDLDWKNMPADVEKMLNAPPGYIGEGGNLIMWFSIEVFRWRSSLQTDIGARSRAPLTASWRGKLFTHGIFFAHDKEPDPGSERRRSLFKPFPNKWTTIPQSWDRK